RERPLLLAPGRGPLLLPPGPAYREAQQEEPRRAAQRPAEQAQVAGARRAAGVQGRGEELPGLLGPGPVLVRVGALPRDGGVGQLRSEGAGHLIDARVASDVGVVEDLPGGFLGREVDAPGG